MSGESASVRQRLPKDQEIASVSPDNEALTVGLENRQVEEGTVANLRVFWDQRKFILRAGFYALLASTCVAILIPSRYQSMTRLMPPDSPSGLGIGLLSAMTGSAGSQGLGMQGLGGIASDLLGMKSSGALFVGVIESQTV